MFTTVKVLTEVQNNGGIQKRELDDYYVSVDMAKHICMLQRNEIGKQYREYLIRVDKLYKEKLTAEYKIARKKSKQVRIDFTNTLHERGYEKKYDYINTTRAMKKSLGIVAKKDEMTKAEVLKVTAAECLARAMLVDEMGYHEVNPVCVEASEIVNKAMMRKLTA